MNNTARVTLNSEVVLDEVLEAVFHSTNDGELMQAILALDLKVADTSFTNLLIKKLVESNRTEGVRIKLKIDGEKF